MIGTLVFWPLIMLMFIITVVISLFDKGEEVHRTILMQRTVVCPEQELLDTTLTAFLGKLIFVVNTQSISHRAVRLDILALFGKVEIVIPEDVGVLSEQTTLFATARSKAAGVSCRPGGFAEPAAEPEPPLAVGDPVFVRKDREVRDN